MKINPPGCRSNCKIRRPNMEYSPVNYSIALTCKMTSVSL